MQNRKVYKSNFLQNEGIVIQEKLVNFYKNIRTSDFFGKAFESIATRVIIVVMALIINIVVARVLGPEGRGLYAVATAIGVIGIRFGLLGLNQANTYYVARKPELLSVLTGNSLLISFILGTVGIFLAWIVFWFFPAIGPLKGILLILSLIYIPFGLAYTLFQSLLLGLHKVHEYNKIELIGKVVSLALFFIILAYNLVSVELVFTATILFSMILTCLWSYRILISCVNFKLSFSFAEFSDNTGYGFKVYLATFFMYLVTTVDLLMIKYMIGPEEAGYYSVASNMAMTTNYMLASVVGLILFPRLSALKDEVLKWNMVKKVSLVIGFSMALLVLCLSLLAKPVVLIVLGEEFLPAVKPFIILSIGMIFFGITNILFQYFASIDLPWNAVSIWIIVCLVNIGMNFYIIPRYNICGASVVSLLSCFIALIMHFFIKKYQ